MGFAEILTRARLGERGLGIGRRCNLGEAGPVLFRWSRHERSKASPRSADFVSGTLHCEWLPWVYAGIKRPSGAANAARALRSRPVTQELTTGMAEGFVISSAVKMATTNLLLDALPRSVHATLKDDFNEVHLRRGEVLHKPGEVIRDLYFPLTSLISITVTMRDGKTAETGVIGNREVVGVNAFMGRRETTQTEYITQIAGAALHIDAAPLRKEFDENGGLRDVLLKYTQAIIAQISQNAACNRLHAVEQRYARWLLEARDRIQSEHIALTQEFVGEMLGVRRVTVTQVATKFAAMHIITLKRGVTNIEDVAALEGASCECYRVITDEYDRLLEKHARHTKR